MSSLRGVGRFCSLVVQNLTGTTDSIAALPSGKLGDGAEAYCVANAGVYRLNQSGGTFNLSPGYIGASGGGTWVLQSPGGASVSQANDVNFGVSTAATANTWIALPVTAGAYLYPLPSTSWATNTGAAAMQWLGPSNKHFLVNSIFSLRTASVPLCEDMEFDLSINAANVGTTNFSVSSVVQSWGNNDTSANYYIEFVWSQVITLAQNDTVQMITRPIANATTFLPLRLKMNLLSL
jgi:hypothetical protein